MKNQLALFAWSDTKVNFMLGTWPGIQSSQGFISQIERKKKKVSEMRTCPKIANVYNENMGGIDLHDSLRSRISTHIRSKKWWIPLFYACLDIAIVNSCINWKASKSLDITFHDFVISIIEEIQPPVGWWKTTSSPSSTVTLEKRLDPIVKDFQTCEPFLLKGSRKTEVRNPCIICKKRTNQGCQTCNLFVHFGICWRAHQNQ
jgi:hypothetical protein